MRFKIKPKKSRLYLNEFLIFPRKMKNHWYWLEWGTIVYHYLGGNRYQKFGSMIKRGKHAKQLNETV